MRPEKPGPSCYHCDLLGRVSFGDLFCCHLPWSSLGGVGTRVLCMNTIFQLPACLSRKADSSQFCFVVPEASVMLPLLTYAIQAVSPLMCTSGSVTFHSYCLPAACWALMKAMMESPLNRAPPSKM